MRHWAVRAFDDLRPDGAGVWLWHPVGWTYLCSKPCGFSVQQMLSWRFFFSFREGRYMSEFLVFWVSGVGWLISYLGKGKNNTKYISLWLEADSWSSFGAMQMSILQTFSTWIPKNKYCTMLAPKNTSFGRTYYSPIFHPGISFYPSYTGTRWSDRTLFELQKWQNSWSYSWRFLYTGTLGVCCFFLDLFLWLLCTMVNHHQPPFGICFFSFSKSKRRTCKSEFYFFLKHKKLDLFFKSSLATDNRRINTHFFGSKYTGCHLDVIQLTV